MNPASPPPLRLLSLDGGAIKGTFTAAMLAAWEKDTGLQVADHFDLVAGTSTGGRRWRQRGGGRPRHLDRHGIAARAGPAALPQLDPRLRGGRRSDRCGRRVLGWSSDVLGMKGTARLWSAANRQLMAEFSYQGPVTSACFDQQEQCILTVCEHGTLAQWPISFDPAIPIEERLVEFEVRSATTLESSGEVRVLTEAEWAARKARHAELRRKRGLP